jgi:hypothetical protein
VLKVRKVRWDSKELEDLRGPQEHKEPKEHKEEKDKGVLPVR